jgi:hypothetical protein
MGPNNIKVAFSQGGRIIDEYPINPANYLEGFIEGYWESHKVGTDTFTHAKEMSRFVC